LLYGQTSLSIEKRVSRRSTRIESWLITTLTTLALIKMGLVRGQPSSRFMDGSHFYHHGGNDECGPLPASRETHHLNKVTPTKMKTTTPMRTGATGIRASTPRQTLELMVTIIIHNAVRRIAMADARREKAKAKTSILPMAHTPAGMKVTVHGDLGVRATNVAVGATASHLSVGLGREVGF
jgi:hypothetical protein